MKTLKVFISTSALSVVLALGVSGQVNLSSLEGTNVNVAGQRGKVVVLAVGASWLPLSAKQVEFTNALAKKYAGKDVAFYFVATDSILAKSRNFASDDAIRAFVVSTKLGVPILRDPDGAATLKLYKIDQVPSFVILDKGGILVGEPFGGIDPKFDVTVPLGKTIDKLL